MARKSVIKKVDATDIKEFGIEDFAAKHLSPAELMKFRENNLMNQIHKRDISLAEMRIALLKSETLAANKNLDKVKKTYEIFTNEHKSFMDSLRAAYDLPSEGFNIDIDTGEIHNLPPIRNPNE